MGMSKAKTARDDHIEEQARMFVEQHAVSSGLEPETANTLKMWYTLGARWADAHHSQDASIIEWQTGEPKEYGSYLVLHEDNKGNKVIDHDVWFDNYGRWQSKWNNIIAWCKLDDIKPHKEE